jgi:3-methylfumaryl-CoA hydratase
MPEMRPITEDELAHYRSWVGRRTTTTDSISPDVIHRFAAAIDSPAPDDGCVPPMWHYGLFLNDVPSRELGPDGHPPRGGAMPPVRLQRRMFASADATFIAPLAIGTDAELQSEVISVDHRKGSQGDLVLVRVNDSISQNGAACIIESRTIVYLNAGAPVAPVEPEKNPEPIASGQEIWVPDSVALFRFSAVTFNAHRIHYDLPYARKVEGYPGLVVHGPLLAVRLCNFAGRIKKSTPYKFTFRGEAPSFCGQPIAFTSKDDNEGLTLSARRADGKKAMSATALFKPTG